VRLRHWTLLFSMFFSLCQVSFGQTNDWAVVGQLLSHQKVKVLTNDGKSHVGTIQAVNDGSVRIGKDRVIQKQDVQQVLLWSPGHHGRNALIGLVGGAGFGVAVGASCGQRDIVTQGQCMAVGAPLFGGLGAGIGALLPSRGHWNSVYQAPRGSDIRPAPTPQ
jgi:hypothetical protein